MIPQNFLFNNSISSGFSFHKITWTNNKQSWDQLSITNILLITNFLMICVNSWQFLSSFFQGHHNDGLGNWSWARYHLCIQYVQWGGLFYILPRRLFYRGVLWRKEGTLSFQVRHLFYSGQAVGIFESRNLQLDRRDVRWFRKVGIVREVCSE